MDEMESDIQNYFEHLYLLARYCYTTTLSPSETLSLPFSIERLPWEQKCHDRKGVLSLGDCGVKPKYNRRIIVNMACPLSTLWVENKKSVSRASIY